MLTYSESLRILGLQSGATEQDIKRAFRRLAQQWHPDKYPAGSVEQARATVKFRQIKEACDVLSAAGSQPPPLPQQRPPGARSPRSSYSQSSSRPRRRYNGPYASSAPSSRSRSTSGPILPLGCSVWIAFILLLNLARCSSNYFQSQARERSESKELQEILELEAKERAKKRAASEVER